MKNQSEDWFPFNAVCSAANVQIDLIETAWDLRELDVNVQLLKLG